MASSMWGKRQLCYRTQTQRTGATTLVRGPQRGEFVLMLTLIGIWAAMRNSGSVVGGAISFSNNYDKSSAGGVAWSTYLIFLAFRTSKIRQRETSLTGRRMYGIRVGISVVAYSASTQTQRQQHTNVRTDSMEARIRCFIEDLAA